MTQRILCALIFFMAAIAPARADAVFFLEEPYGHYGSWNPTGHAAVYLTGICAASPTELRRCEPGEGGVVISRYHRVGGYDWIAIPLLPYLYAVDSLDEIPQSVDPSEVAALRDAYRREHLLELVPSDARDRAPNGDWYELVGSAYDRTIYGYRIPTRPEQDDAFITRYNRRKNKSSYTLLSNNCADFARQVMNFFAPHAVHRNIIVDAGIMTPKQVARSLTSYSRHHPEFSLTVIKIPQVAGKVERSRHPAGVFEGLLKSKRYLVPLAYLQPEVAGSLLIAYLTEGRFDPRRHAVPFDVASAFQPRPAEQREATATASATGSSSAIMGAAASVE